MTVTYLFVPAHEGRKVEKALSSQSDAVILDLEDGVPDAEKGAARAAVARILDGRQAWTRPETWIRVNDSAGPQFAEDLTAIDWDRATGAVVPEAEDPDAVERLASAGARRLVLLIESVRGFDMLVSLVGATPRVSKRLAIGTWDLACDLGLFAVDDPDDSELMWQLRGRLVVESRRLGLNAPIDGIYARLDDAEGLRRVCQRAARMGFTAKLLIHPAQIAPARAVFAQDEDALQFAREVIAAYEQALGEGRGVVRVRARAVDRPMVAKARAVLAREETSVS